MRAATEFTALWESGAPVGAADIHCICCVFSDTGGADSDLQVSENEGEEGKDGGQAGGGESNSTTWMYLFYLINYSEAIINFPLLTVQYFLHSTSFFNAIKSWITQFKASRFHFFISIFISQSIFWNHSFLCSFLLCLMLKLWKLTLLVSHLLGKFYLPTIWSLFGNLPCHFRNLDLKEISVFHGSKLLYRICKESKRTEALSIK